MLTFSFLVEKDCLSLFWFFHTFSLKIKMAPTMHHLPDVPPEISTIFLISKTMIIGADFQIDYNNQLLTLTLTLTSTCWAR